LGIVKKGLKNLFWKSKGKWSLECPKRKYEYNVEMELKNLGIEGVYWIRLAHGRDQKWALVNTIMNIPVT
jgi:hypothetical protein